MEQKIKILIPDKNFRKESLDNLNNLYSDICVFDLSDDNKIHIVCKLDNIDDIYCVIINVKNITAQEAKHYIYDVMTTYKNDEDCTGCNFIFIPIRTEEDKIIKLSNTERTLELIH